MERIVYFGQGTTDRDMGITAERLASRLNSHEGMVSVKDTIAAVPGVHSIEEMMPGVSAVGFAIGVNSVGSQVYVEVYEPLGAPGKFWWQTRFEPMAGEERAKHVCPVCSESIKTAVDPSDSTAKPGKDGPAICFCPGCTMLLIWANLSSDTLRHVPVREFEGWPFGVRQAVINAKTELMRVQAEERARREAAIDRGVTGAVYSRRLQDREDSAE